MALYGLSEAGLARIMPTSFVAEGVKERLNLQRALRDHPEILADDLLIVAEEFGDWEDSRRRIDLLALDRSGHLVVIELKRSDDGGFMDLQAIRYAAMVANMTFEQVARAHTGYLKQRGIQQEGAAALKAFLGVDDATEPEIYSQTPRIILVSADFSVELTTSVLWLNDNGMDIRCVRLRPFRIDKHLLVDSSQVIPLRGSEDYLVRLREKTAEVEQSIAARRERTLSILVRNGLVQSGTRLEFHLSTLKGWGVNTLPAPMLLATFAALDKRENVIWDHDGQAYSLSGLTSVVGREMGVELPVNGYLYWHILGAPEKNLWELAEAFR